jgi:glutathione S-transferase
VRAHSESRIDTPSRASAMSASLVSRPAVLGRRLVAAKASARPARRRAVATSAAASDDAPLRRALRTVDTGALMKGTEAPEATQQTATKETPAAATKAEPVVVSATAGSASEDAADAFTLRGPEPQKFGVADGELANVLTASGSFVTRAVSGALCEGWTPSIVEGECPKGTYTLGEIGGRYIKETSDTHKFPRPAMPIELYEFEGCPFCKKVREAVIWLDLDVLFFPCPQGGPTFRERVKAEGGKSMFPYMKDPNTGVAMYESDDIIDYLYDTYGPGKEKVSTLLRAGAFTVLTAGFGLAPRMGAGSRYRAARMPEKPITVYSYEASPFCKLVREKLVELEIPHLMKSCGRGSMKRQELVDRRGVFQAPYIEDPNTGTAMFESSAIVKYLEETYAEAA